MNSSDVLYYWWMGRPKQRIMQIRGISNVNWLQWIHLYPEFWMAVGLNAWIEQKVGFISLLQVQALPKGQEHGFRVLVLGQSSFEAARFTHRSQRPPQTSVLSQPHYNFFSKLFY